MACDSFFIDRVDRGLVDRLLTKLDEDNNYSYSGSNPWYVAKNNFPKIKFVTEWNPINSELKITVSNKPFIVGCGMIEGELRKFISELAGLPQ